VTKLSEVKKEAAHKSSFLYSFDIKKYQEVLENVGLFII